MNTLKSTLDKKSLVWPIAISLALLAGYKFIHDYLMVIALSALTAYMLYPIYSVLHKKIKSTGAALALTTLLSFLLVLIPVSVVLSVTVNQTRVLISDVQSESFSSKIDSATSSATSLYEKLNDKISGSLHTKIDLSRETIVSKIKEKAPEVLNSGLQIITNTAGSVPHFFTLLILYIYLFTAMISSKETILKTIKGISPFEERINDIYLKKISFMTGAMVRGQAIIAVSQGIIGALSLWIAGVDYIVFFLVFLVFMSFIPLGGGIITLPIGIILLLTGNIWQGIFVIAVHLIIVSNIDSVLRAKLVHKDARLNGALMILSTFAGVGFFGLAGVIYGPIIMIILTTTIQLYIEEKQKLVQD